MIDIDAMTSNEWLNYRENLLEDFYKQGHVLKPTIGCSCCDPDDGYTCFECECNQIEKSREKL
jgi:hypothetical protein